jgi:biotin operon repressor
VNLPTVHEALRSTPLTLAVLSEKCGLPRRAVEEELQRLRLAGVPVVTSSDGAWVSEDPEVVRECAARLRSRLINQAKTARALLRTARRLEDRNARPLIFDWSGPQ